MPFLLQDVERVVEVNCRRMVHSRSSPKTSKKCSGGLRSSERAGQFTWLSCSCCKKSLTTAKLRPVDRLITHPREVNFTTDTMTVSIVLKSNYFSINIARNHKREITCARSIASLLGVLWVIPRDRIYTEC